MVGQKKKEGGAKIERDEKKERGFAHLEERPTFTELSDTT